MAGNNLNSLRMKDGKIVGMNGPTEQEHSYIQFKENAVQLSNVVVLGSASQVNFQTQNVQISDKDLELAYDATLTDKATGIISSAIKFGDGIVSLTAHSDDFVFTNSTAASVNVFELDTRVSDEESNRGSDVLSLDTRVSDEESNRAADVLSLSDAIGVSTINDNFAQGLLANTEFIPNSTVVEFSNQVVMGTNIINSQPFEDGSGVDIYIGNRENPTRKFRVTPTDGNEYFSVNNQAVNMYHPTKIFGTPGNVNNFVLFSENNITATTAGAGVVTANEFTTASDENLKKNIVNITNALDSVLNLRGVRYNWRDENRPAVEVGVIAQDVQKDFPELVIKKDDHLTVNYSRLVAVLIEAVKELDTRVKALESKA